MMYVSSCLYGLLISLALNALLTLTEGTGLSLVILALVFGALIYFLRRPLLKIKELEDQIDRLHRRVTAAEQKAAELHARIGILEKRKEDGQTNG